MNPPSHQTLYQQIAQRVQSADAFASVEPKSNALLCRAKHTESNTQYRVSLAPDSATAWVGLYSPDRWLSESIEADLMHLGDHIEELLEEELLEQGLNTRLPVEHFRDEDKQYVFRSPVPLAGLPSNQPAALADRLSRVLLAYEATFRHLGDMAPPEA